MTDAPRGQGTPPDRIAARRAARERVMQAVYAATMQGGELLELLQALTAGDERLDDATRAFALALATRTAENYDACEELLQTHAEHWALNRLAAVDRAILHIAVTEFLAFPDIPPKVTIDEAIEIAKRFSTPDSGRFVNGILDAVLTDLRARGLLVKHGRGLRGS